MIIAIGSLLTCLNMITDILIYRLLVGPLAGLSVLLNMLTNWTPKTQEAVGRKKTSGKSYKALYDLC